MHAHRTNSTRLKSAPCPLHPRYVKDMFPGLPAHRRGVPSHTPLSSVLHQYKDAEVEWAHDKVRTTVFRTQSICSCLYVPMIGFCFRAIQGFYPTILQTDRGIKQLPLIHHILVPIRPGLHPLPCSPKLPAPPVSMIYAERHPHMPNMSYHVFSSIKTNPQTQLPRFPCSL